MMMMVTKTTSIMLKMTMMCKRWCRDTDDDNAYVDGGNEDVDDRPCKTSKTIQTKFKLSLACIDPPHETAIRAVKIQSMMKSMMKSTVGLELLSDIFECHGTCSIFVHRACSIFYATCSLVYETCFKVHTYRMFYGTKGHAWRTIERVPGSARGFRAPHVSNGLEHKWGP